MSNSRKDYLKKIQDINNNKDSSDNTISVNESQEYNDLIRLYKNSLLWKPGEYSVIARVHIADTNETIEHAFSFRLSELEIDTLNKNIEFAKQNGYVMTITGRRRQIPEIVKFLCNYHFPLDSYSKKAYNIG